MQRRNLSVAALLAVFTGISMQAQGQGQSGSAASSGIHSAAHQLSPAGSTSTESVDPATFVKKAAMGGLTEVTLSNAAATKAQDPAVKQFAAQMVTDHTQANDELKALAKRKGWPLPAALDAQHQQIVQKINNESGAAFDRAYGKQMREDHDKTIALFEGAANSSDPDLAAFANKTLPTLKEHKTMTQKLPGSQRSAMATGTSRSTH